MRRPLRKTTLALCALLLLVDLLFWLDFSPVLTGVFIQRPDRYYVVCFWHQGLTVQWDRKRMERPGAYAFWERGYAEAVTGLHSTPGKPLIFGFEAGHPSLLKGSHCHVPHWPFALIMSAAIVWTAWPLIKEDRQRTRRLAGKCGQCGYDVRANKHRCSECGTAIQCNEADRCT
jgi:hypothetical protein